MSYTKGCYVGQEIIVRIKHRGHPAKKLRGAETIQIEPGLIVKATNIGRVRGCFAKTGQHRARLCSL